jgi:hypothetical protein
MEISLTSNRALPPNWIQKIFATMQGHYGSRFLNMWRTGQVLPDGTDAGVANAMDHWSRKLAGYAHSPETIKRTLDNLPPDPPSLPQFCEMMRLNYVQPNTLAITKQQTAEEIATNKKRLAALLSTLKMNGGKANDMEHS